MLFYLRSRVDGILQFTFLAIVDRESLHEEGCEARASASAEGVEDEETLESCALVSQLPDPVQYQVYNLLADSVVTSCIVVSSVFLACDQLLGVEQLSVCARPYLI